MRIAFVIATNSSGGAERVIVTLANYFAEVGNTVFLYNFDKDSSFYSISDQVNVIKLGNKYEGISRTKTRAFRVFLIYKALLKEFKHIKPDVVIPFLFNSELPTITAAHKLSIPCITSVRNTPSAYPFYQRLYRKMMYPRIAGIVLQSNMVLNHSDFANVRNKVVIMNPTTYNILDHRVNVDMNKIISVGRLNQQKNHQLTIRAFANVANEFPNAKLHIFGAGEEEDNLNNLINTLQLEDRVVLEGAVANAFQQNLDARLFVMASDYEGFPNALLEAMACHIPVICSDFDTGIAKELIGDDENGLLFAVGNLEELEGKLKYALHHFADCEQKADKASGLCHQFEYHNIGRQWNDYINKVVAINS